MGATVKIVLAYLMMTGQVAIEAAFLVWLWSWLSRRKVRWLRFPWFVIVAGLSIALVNELHYLPRGSWIPGWGLGLAGMITAFVYIVAERAPYSGCNGTYTVKP